jgi:hypothetical protein
MRAACTQSINHKRMSPPHAAIPQATLDLDALLSRPPPAEKRKGKPKPSSAASNAGDTLQKAIEIEGLEGFRSDWLMRRKPSIYHDLQGGPTPYTMTYHQHAARTGRDNEITPKRNPPKMAQKLP